MEPPLEPFDIRRSNMYHIWLMQEAEINRNRWYLSEQAGYDVGHERASWDWGMRFRAAWVSGLKASGVYPT